MGHLTEKQQHEKRLELNMEGMPPYVHEYILAQRRSDRSPSTLLGYVYEYKKFFQWLIDEKIANVTSIEDIPLSTLEHLRKDDVEIFVDLLKNEDIQVNENVKKKRSVSAVNRSLSALKSLFNYLTTKTEIESGERAGECYFYRNVMSKIPISKEKESANSRANKISAVIYHDEDITDFLDFVKSEYETKLNGRGLHSFQKAKERDVAILSLFLGTGLRVGELATLTMDSVDFRKCKITTVRKGNKKDIIDILPEAMEDLKVYLEVRNSRYKATDKDPYIFVSNYRSEVKPLTVRGIENLVDKYTKAFNQSSKGLSPHKLRHTFAGDYLKNGGSLVLLRDQLGHNSIETTALYTNLSDTERKKVIENMSKSRKKTKKED